MSVTFNKLSRSILVVGSDNNSRACRIDRCETIDLARSLFSKAKDLIGSKAVFHAAGGNDPSRWFFAIDEVVEDPADIERALISLDSEEFDPAHTSPDWEVCDEPEDDDLGLRSYAESVVRSESIAESTIHCARLVSSLNFFLADTREISKFEWMDLRSGFRVQKALLEDVNNDFELSELLAEKIAIVDKKVAACKKR